jgi:hypothetical protein
MFTSVPSLDAVMQCLAPVFTQPSFQTQGAIFLGWIMCLKHRTEFAVFETIQAESPVSRQQRHPFDAFYNFFSRSAWTVNRLGNAVAVAAVTRLCPTRTLYLAVDDTLLHKRGKSVFGLGWFRDAVASTAERVAVASGNHWVVLGLTIAIPGTNKIYFLPLLARLHLVGQEGTSEPALARAMLLEVQGWFPDRRLVLAGDGAYSAEPLLKDLPAGIDYVGRMRSDAEIYDSRVPERPKSMRGPKPKKGPRLPNPKKVVSLADQAAQGRGSQETSWNWQKVQATAYGTTRELLAITFLAVWPEVLGLRAVRVVLVRDPEGKSRDTYLFTTNVEASIAWVIETYARRWSIEVAFKASKQVMEIEAPQHWCRASIEKLAPWVWLMQSVVSLWYFTQGKDLPEARKARAALGPWETEWSLAHMVRILRRVILHQAITSKSASTADMVQLLHNLENYLNLAV